MPELRAARRQPAAAAAKNTASKDIKSEGEIPKVGLGHVVVLSLGVYGCFLTQGLVQESIYATRDDGTKFGYPVFLVSLVCAVSALVGYCLVTALGTSQVISAIFNQQPNHSHSAAARKLLREGFYISLSYVGAMICTNYSLTKVNYPTQVLVKSAKAVPVILGGILIYRRKYPVSDYLAVIMVTGSLILFQTANMKGGGRSSSMIGFGVLCCSLLLDGLTGPRQDKLVSEYRLGTGDLMLLLNMFSAPVGLTASIVLEGGLEPWLYVLKHSSFLIPRVLAFIVCGALGQVFIVSLLTYVGSLRLTLITTSRKFFAILLSVLWFRHPLSLQQWIAVAIIMSTGLLKFIAR